MKITYKGDYALKAILDLSYNFREGNAVPLADIVTDELNPQTLPLTHLSIPAL